MPFFSKMMFRAVQWAARKGLRGDPPASDAESKHQARRTGVRGETYAYWLLRSQGYIFIARNYTVPGMKGEIDLVGYDGPALTFVEVKTRTVDDRQAGLPEDSVNPEKRRRLVRMARQFLAEQRIEEAPCRFDVLAIESRPGAAPVVRLHKDAFTAG